MKRVFYLDGRPVAIKVDGIELQNVSMVELLSETDGVVRVTFAPDELVRVDLQQPTQDIS